jgi:hypothetical protein
LFKSIPRSGGRTWRTHEEREEEEAIRFHFHKVTLGEQRDPLRMEGEWKRKPAMSFFDRSSIQQSVSRGNRALTAPRSEHLLDQQQWLEFSQGTRPVTVQNRNDRLQSGGPQLSGVVMNHALRAEETRAMEQRSRLLTQDNPNSQQHQLSGFLGLR